MAREFSRTDRVAQQIHKEVASILQNELKNRDPRMGFVTVSGVDVSRDLAYAKIYVTFFDEDPEKTKLNMEVLKDNTSFIRSVLAKAVRMRSVPNIKFLQDTSVTEGMRISGIVTETLAKDQEKALAAGRDLNADKDNTEES